MNELLNKYDRETRETRMFNNWLQADVPSLPVSNIPQRHALLTA